MAAAFFPLFVSTIALTRVLLYLCPVPAPTVWGVRFHHYMYGLMGISIGLLTHSLTIYAVGLGLFVDELTYLLIRGKTHDDNYSWPSLLGTLLWMIIVYLFRPYLVALLGA